MMGTRKVGGTYKKQAKTRARKHQDSGNAHQSAMTRYRNDRSGYQQEFAELRILPYRRLDVRNQRPVFESKMKIIAELSQILSPGIHDLNQ
jgi:hypothetical protein